MNPKWQSRFEIKPERWCFVPTEQSRTLGAEILSSLSVKWTPPRYYYHLGPGGHVAAVKAHEGNSHFVKLDIENFFGAINRTRVTRALKRRFGWEQGRAWANASTVRDPRTKTRTMLPYGFVQSQMLASLCLADSAVGSCLDELAVAKSVAVSVYVDDIIVSSKEESSVQEAYAMLCVAAERSKFAWNAGKSEGPSHKITAFNIDISSAPPQVSAERMETFRAMIQADLAHTARIGGVVGYVRSINPTQSDTLLESRATESRG